MNKPKFETPDMVEKNIEKLAEIFPNCITEARDENGKVKKAVNFEMLQQILSTEFPPEGSPERYEFTWVGKRAAIAEANKPIRKTLRPCKTESKNWDTTENLYIEGDNLEVLKLLQESYLGKVKMIYIDPPYNTGNDFIYRDDFKQTQQEYDELAGLFDEDENRLFKNTETNGRFHSDWCSMMYSRLMLAKNFLSDDGVIFISIDDNEQENLKKICDEVFGESNFVGCAIRKTKSMTNDIKSGFNIQHENILIFSKNINLINLIGEIKNLDNYQNLDSDPNGEWCSGDPSAKSGGDGTYFEIRNPYTGTIDYPPKGRYWAFSKTTFEKYVRSGKIKFKKVVANNERGFIFKRYKNELQTIFNPFNSLFAIENEYMNQNATKELNILLSASIFTYPKPVLLIKCMINSFNDKNAIIVDFFSGSATTAHAVMQLNAEDGGHRKFIMVQLPEVCDENSEAYKAGYKNICEIGKERIRRAGEKIKADNPLTTQDLDIGFRVFKVDSSNMNDVYYSAGEYSKDMLTNLEDNIKPDRTDLDLLFGCLLDWGLPISLPYTSEQIENCTVHTYNEGDLVACFDENIPENVIKEIAKRKPMRAVFRDAGFGSSPEKINVTEIFKMLAPDTDVKVI